MSDQDEISRLLAEANAQTEAEAEAPVEQAPPSPPPTPRKAPRRIIGRNNDVVGFAWLNGSLHAASYRRQKVTHTWSCPTPVLTIADFESVVDDALTQLEFGGTEMFLLLEHALFAHQTETIPAFSANVARTYMRTRIQRHEQEHGPVLWVSQPTGAIGDKQSLLIHLLPRDFYEELNRVLLKRHLDLTRILPLVVPLQHELNKIPTGKHTPVLVVAQVGSGTSVVAAQVGGSLLFSRTLLADLNREPGRVGVEVNRSLLYAKQHYDCGGARVWLMAETDHAADEIGAKCGSNKKVVVLPITPFDWLQTTVKLSPQQPINLLAGYLRTKRRTQLTRAAILAAGWLGLAALIMQNVDNAHRWKAEQARLTELKSREAALVAERDQLTERNARIARDQQFIERVSLDRLGPVPGRLLGLVSTALPDSARLSDFTIKWDPESGIWSFRMDGTISADDETARGLMSEFQAQLTKSPLRARFNEGPRTLATGALNPFVSSDTQRFSLEGVILEK